MKKDIFTKLILNWTWGETKLQIQMHVNLLPFNIFNRFTTLLQIDKVENNLLFSALRPLEEVWEAQLVDFVTGAHTGAPSTHSL